MKGFPGSMPAGGHGAGAGKAFHGGPLAKVFKVFGMEPVGRLSANII
jgi:hypothetical protein